MRPFFRTVRDRVLKVSIRTGFEGRYPNRFWFGTAGKYMLGFVVTGFRTIHNGF